MHNLLTDFRKNVHFEENANKLVTCPGQNPSVPSASFKPIYSTLHKIMPQILLDE